MRLLLDTHAFLWWATDDTRLTPIARQAISDERHTVFVSAASAWEVATKARLGKLPGFARVLAQWLPLVAAEGFSGLPVDPRHALRAGNYDVDHADPFDRMLAAQAELEGLNLVTADPALQRFPVRTLW
jgi:PIN domain nuclease of toxin-antitoxin system